MIRTLAVALVVAVLLFAICRESVRAADPVVLDLQVEAPDHLTVGDHLRYVIKVEADRGTGLALAPDALPAALTLTGAPVAATRPIAGGRVEMTLTLEMAPFVTGQIDVPPIKLRYQTPTGSSGEVVTRPTRLEVESVLPASGQLEPRDLKPQAQIGSASSGWLLPAVAAAALLAIAGAALFVAYRRRARLRAVAVPELEPLVFGPEDRARAVFDQAGGEFIAGHDYVAYYAAIAITVREYLTERFGFPAFALTTRELQDQMVRRGGMDRWQARLAGGLLTQCDSVIFAHYRPALERADADLTAAYEIVEMSRPALRLKVPVS